MVVERELFIYTAFWLFCHGYCHGEGEGGGGGGRGGVRNVRSSG